MFVLLHFYIYSFFCPSSRRVTQNYVVLISTEIILLLIAIKLYQHNKLACSSNLLIFIGVIGPWWSAIIDPTIINGNLFPLIYITIPILFTSFFSPVSTSIVIGVLQILVFTTFIYLGDFDLSMGASSLFFFIIFIFAISLIINIQNRNNRQIISLQVDKLKEQAIRDPLTCLYNRRFLNEFLKKEFARLERVSGKLSIIIFDIDNFKHFNDTYGHNCGDEILITISNLLKNNFRKSDVNCRYGGDEFLIALSDSSPKQTEIRAKNLQNLITEKKFDYFNKDEMPVTISVGIATYPDHGNTVDDVLKAADQALYKAKKLGKNRIEL